MLVVGCSEHYEQRLEHTIDRMKYQRRLNENLADPATKGRLEQLRIFVRPPKGMTGPTQTFQLAVIEPGKFDVEASFMEPREAKPAHSRPGQGDQDTRQEGSAQGRAGAARRLYHRHRGTASNVYGADLNTSDFKEDKKGENSYKFKLLDLNAKNIQIYLYGAKNGPYEVALIFEYPKSEHNSVNPKIGLCLEAFATGDKAKREFTGGEEEEGSEGGEENASPSRFDPRIVSAAEATVDSWFGRGLVSACPPLRA